MQDNSHFLRYVVSSPVAEICSHDLVHSITLIPIDIFDNMAWQTLRKEKLTPTKQAIVNMHETPAHVSQLIHAKVTNFAN